VRLPEEAAEVLRRRHTKRIDLKTKKLNKVLANLERDRARLEVMREEKKLGELLKPELSKIPRGAREALVMDWETGQARPIALDPALSAKENMEKIFARGKKAERGLPLVTARAQSTQRMLAELEQLRAVVAKAELDELLALAEDEPERVSPGAAKSKSADEKKPIDRWSRRFEAVDGTEIRVGRGAKENDRLTLSAAKGDDVWLHARGTQGAHVLIRVPKGGKPSPEALLDAAHLAAHYSGAKNDSKVEVVYTEARHVKKTKGDPPGRVSVAKGRTILVALDAARIDRLFSRTR
jgi:predicted ribosome quality control (RQC) complex YloA/Tae2 family protein